MNTIPVGTDVRVYLGADGTQRGIITAIRPSERFGYVYAVRIDGERRQRYPLLRKNITEVNPERTP
jgi:hypothetical protein